MYSAASVISAKCHYHQCIPVLIIILSPGTYLMVREVPGQVHIPSENLNIVLELQQFKIVCLHPNGPQLYSPSQTPVLSAEKEG
jgi:hypothetical protein